MPLSGDNIMGTVVVPNGNSEVVLYTPPATNISVGSGVMPPTTTVHTFGPFDLENQAELEAAAREAADSVALEAHTLVHGDRNASYGHPLDDFAKTAEFWTTYLRAKGLLAEGVALDPEDVGLMMVFVKISRQANAPKRDNLTDIAGYAETVHRVITERERRAAESDVLL
jgi:hypothetical protein